MVYRKELKRLRDEHIDLQTQVASLEIQEKQITAQLELARAELVKHGGGLDDGSD